MAPAQAYLSTWRTAIRERNSGPSGSPTIILTTTTTTTLRLKLKFRIQLVVTSVCVQFRSNLNHFPEVSGFCSAFVEMRASQVSNQVVSYITNVSARVHFFSQSSSRRYQDLVTAESRHVRQCISV